jgi:D-glycero-beta-D-manno-heptose-7-phosphate kinase
LLSSDLRAVFATSKVLVIGDLMLDEYLFGTVNRVSPEAPVPVVDVKTRRYVPGGAANVAANVRSLGAEVKLVGLCGEDLAAETLRRILSDAGIEPRWLVPSAERPTTCKSRVVAGQQQIVRFDTEKRLPVTGTEQARLLACFKEAASESDVCIISDYGKGLFPAEFCQTLIGFVCSGKREVIVDPKGTDYTKYRGCTLVTPNLKEAGQAAGLAIENEDNLRQAGERLLALLPGSSVLITRGADGMTLFRPEQSSLTIPTVAQEVFDVVGAGDTAVAALGVCLAAHLPLETGTKLANIAAGIAVGKQGTVAVSLDEVLRHEETCELLANHVH